MHLHSLDQSNLMKLVYYEVNFTSVILFLDHPIMMGFEPLVNQRLLPPTFPRYAKIIKREEMVNYFSKLIERIKTICEVINIANLHSILVNNLPITLKENIGGEGLMDYLH